MNLGEKRLIYFLLGICLGPILAMGLRMLF